MNEHCRILDDIITSFFKQFYWCFSHDIQDNIRKCMMHCIQIAEYSSVTHKFKCISIEPYNL